MYQDFSITTINTDLVTKSITINATFDIDPITVTDANIQLIDITTRNNVELTFEVISKGLIIHLTEWPTPNKEYAIRIQKLKSVIDENLASGIRRKVTFVSSICSKLEITYPAFDEEISDLRVSFKEILESDQSISVGSYYIEVSTDNAFINLVRNTEVIGRTEIDLNNLSADQYYVRGRVQKDSEYGLWSDTVTFIVKDNLIPTQPSTGNNDPDEDEEIYAPPIRVVSTPEQGETPSSIIIEFDCEIDPESINDILIMRRSI